MKTLDEVIKALEICANNQRCIDGCPYYKNDCPQYEMEKDALHYLKEYRDRKETLRNWTEKAISEQQNIADAYMLYKIASGKEKDNLPLTWDELKTMEGKPVWVEVLSDEIDLSSRWMLVARETKAHSLPLAYTDDIGHWIFGHEDKLGKTWQAYRKERK